MQHKIKPMKLIQLLLLPLLCIALNGNAQQTAPNIGCKDPNLLVQATELRAGLNAQGFELLHDAMISMSSKDDFPIVVRMQAGLFYQIVFIGNTRSKKMNLMVVDPQQQLIIEKQQTPLSQSSNVISFSFTPSTTGDYRFILNQAMKQGLLDARMTVCGSFSILRLKKSL
jgi:hypothetical protein